MGPMRFAIATLGCKVNQYDSQLLRESLVRAGHAVVDLSCGDVHAVIVNTCTVTHRADADARRIIRRALDTNAHVIVTGCQAVVYPDAVKENFPDVEVVRPDHLGVLLGIEPVRFIQGFEGRNRAFVVVQRGCDRFCTYCVVPFARGRPASRPWQEVVSEVRALHGRGIEEIVLAGVNIGLYEGGLARLVQKVLAHTDIPRIRISSMEPFTVEDALIELMAEDPRICNHVHLSIQHASDRILEAMGRPTRAEDIRSLLERICVRVKGVAIGADIIVGFPGEDERDFMQTYALVEEMPFAYLHVFPFSPRPWTKAARMAGRPTQHTVARRALALRELSRNKRQAFAASRVGAVEQVLVTDSMPEGSMGLTSSYLRVASGPQQRAGSIVPMRITGRTGPILTGEPLV